MSARSATDPLGALNVQVAAQPVHPRPGDDTDADHGEQQRDQYVADHREPAFCTRTA